MSATLAAGVVAVVAVAVVVAGCTSTDADPAPTSGSALPTTSTTATAPPPRSAVTAAPSTVELAEGRTPSELVIAVSATLFTSAPVVVVVPASAPSSTFAAAARAATTLGVPLLLDPRIQPRLPSATPTTGAATSGAPTGATPTTGATTTGGPTTAVPTTAGSPVPGDPLVTEVARLDASVVLAVGTTAQGLGERLPGVDVVAVDASNLAVDDGLAALPPTRPPQPLATTTVVVRAASAGGTAPEVKLAAVAAARATARAAGATVVSVRSTDPRADGAAISALAQAPRGPLLAVGTTFGPLERLSRRLAVARTGAQLPGGGQRMFPGRALVALYGHPSGGALGALGEQGIAATITRAAQIAVPYRSLYDVPVVPALEIIATVASGSAGADKDYSNETPLETLLPLIDAATTAGMYVVLDLQPGRADLVEQAQRYRSLLLRPNVGLALDPEWALTSDQKPLKQIGSLSATQVNAVLAWLADLTREANLPQKLVVLHQFTLAMLGDERRIDTTHDELALLVHADGQGGRSAKESTWASIVNAAPDGVHFGWKNFYDEDPQLASPADTVRRTPEPLMVSYQ